MEPDSFSEVPNTNEIGTNTTTIEAATQNDLSEEIPGLYELPPETQEVVIEAYGHYEELRQTIESHTKGVELYIEKIPEALSIIEKNISSNEQTPTEVPPGKQEYEEDTVNIVTLCQKVDELGVGNLDTKKQLAVYLKLEEYAKKHNAEGLKVKLEEIENIEEIKKYHANTPRAIIQRIQDNRRVQNLESEDRIKQNSFERYTSHLGWIITSTTEDYTHGDKYKMNTDYDFAFEDLRDMCRDTSIASNENFMELLDEKTKAIGDIQKKINDEEVCFKQIAERTGMDTDIVTGHYPKTKHDTPLEEAKGSFGGIAIKDRLKRSREVLYKEMQETSPKISEQLLGITMEELIPSMKKIVDGNKEYLEKYKKIQEMLPNREEVENFNFMKILEDTVDNFHTRQEEEEEALKEILESKRLLFHGAENDESRLGIATQGAMSRKMQEEINGKSYYRTDWERVTEEQRWQPTERESVMVFFSKNIPHHYGFRNNGTNGKIDDKRDFLFVGIPKGVAMRNYAMTRVQTHEKDGGDGELALFDKESPEGGVIIDTKEPYLFIGTDTFNHLTSIYGEEWKQKMKERWGDRVQIYDTFGGVPKSIENLDLPPVNKARLLPTKFKYWSKSGTKSGIYKIQYS